VGRQAEAKLMPADPPEEAVGESNQTLNLTIDAPDVIAHSQLKLYDDEPPRNKGIFLTFQQFRAMLEKKVIYGSRNRILLLAQVPYR